MRDFIDGHSLSPDVARTRELTDTLELVRERLEGALNAPAYADEVMALAIIDIDRRIGARP
ncbi:hypothetical protein [Aureimonas glaciei]|uniref:Uncharacterized protein n=1 Tax=Aureimonas glaciei TaxID=1776957 RepID=A0A916YHV4_9HYPH|nr:hypothetical protein [Aureimonas glaciei]GGD43930.1 hypothetical protein GCM10011335_53200 [Aureimonas glaciei]